MMCPRPVYCIIKPPRNRTWSFKQLVFVLKICLQVAIYPSLIQPAEIFPQSLVGSIGDLQMWFAKCHLCIWIRYYTTNSGLLNFNKFKVFQFIARSSIKLTLLIYLQLIAFRSSHIINKMVTYVCLNLNNTYSIVNIYKYSIRKNWTFPFFFLEWQTMCDRFRKNESKTFIRDRE